MDAYATASYHFPTRAWGLANPTARFCRADSRDVALLGDCFDLKVNVHSKEFKQYREGRSGKLSAYGVKVLVWTVRLRASRRTPVALPAPSRVRLRLLHPLIIPPLQTQHGLIVEEPIVALAGYSDVSLMRNSAVLRQLGPGDVVMYDKAIRSLRYVLP